MAFPDLYVTIPRHGYEEFRDRLQRALSNIDSCVIACSTETMAESVLRTATQRWEAYSFWVKYLVYKRPTLAYVKNFIHSELSYLHNRRNRIVSILDLLEIAGNSDSIHIPGDQYSKIDEWAQDHLMESSIQRGLHNHV